VKLLITGSIAYDYLMSFPGKFSDSFIKEKLDKISVSFLVDSLEKRHGGCAANIAYSLALLGESPVLAGSAGLDFNEYETRLAAAGVDCSAVKRVDTVFTASFFCNTDSENNQIASFYTGAMQHAREISLEGFKNQNALAVISPNDPEAMSRHAEECRMFNIPFIYDPGQQIVRLEGETLSRGARGSKAMILNEYELELFCKKTEMDKSGILDISEALIVTLGEHGAEIFTKEKTVMIPTVKPERLLDPTGVGDAFRSGLLKGLVCGLSWEIAGRMGALAAAYVLETDGPQSHHYNLDLFIKRYEAYFGTDHKFKEALNK
jgi:adenosine kinase